MLNMNEEESNNSIYFSFKMFIIIFITYFFVTSRVFVNKILGHINSASSGLMSMLKRCCVQGIALAIIVIMMNILDQIEFP